MSLEHIGGGFYLAPSTAARWRKAGSPELYNDYSAWRSHAMQTELRALFLAGKGAYAAPPGESNHEKGAAFDIKYPADRAACLAAGLIPDRNEWWHFNDPAAARLPVVLALPTPITLPTGETTMVIIQNKHNKDENTRRAIVGEHTFQVLDKKESLRERKFWGRPISVTGAEWLRAKTFVNARRQSAGLPQL